MHPEPGMMVNPSVRLVGELGEGGMGSVWVADHLALKTQVAVKFMATDLVNSPMLLERFDREASLAAQIKSPHVVQMLDHGRTEGGLPYITMELLEGESLADRIDLRGPVNLEDAGTILKQLLGVLDRAHAMGIVHRDIKPENLFLVDAGYDLFVKVLDFGIAKATPKEPGRGLTHSRATIGTPHFMSPEQLLSSRDVDGRSDLWSVAVLLYNALSGDVPFEGETMAALSIEICRGDAQPIRKHLPNVSPALEAWFDIALAKVPDERFQDAPAMLEAFRAAVRGDLRGVTGSRSFSIEDEPTEGAPTMRKPEFTTQPTVAGETSPFGSGAGAPPPQQAAPSQVSAGHSSAGRSGPFAPALTNTDAPSLVTLQGAATERQPAVVAPSRAPLFIGLGLGLLGLLVGGGLAFNAYQTSATRPSPSVVADAPSATVKPAATAVPAPPPTPSATAAPSASAAPSTSAKVAAPTPKPRPQLAPRPVVPPPPSPVAVPPPSPKGGCMVGQGDMVRWVKPCPE